MTGVRRRPSAMRSAVREASAMIVIIGLVPDGVGNARASPIHTPGVSCSSPRGFGHASRRVGAHPARAHLVGGEQPQPAGAQRDPLRAGDERARGRRRRATSACPGQHEHAPGAGGLVQADLLLERLRRVPQSSGSVIEYHGTASPFSSSVDPAAAVVADQADERRRRRGSRAISSLCSAALVNGHRRARRGRSCTARPRSGSRSRPRASANSSTRPACGAPHQACMSSP